MSKQFYGVINTSKSVKEKYTTTNKRGQQITKTRTVAVPESLLILTGESTRVSGMKVLNRELKRLGGTLASTGVL